MFAPVRLRPYSTKPLHSLLQPAVASESQAQLVTLDSGFSRFGGLDLPVLT
jgi:hypothetical protein